MNIDSDLVYITKANFEKIIRRIDGRDITPDYSKIYKSDLTKILSKPELNLLYITMEAYKDFDLLLEEYTVIERREDTKKYAFEGGSPTYHFSEDCERINSDFVNLEIPPEIKAKEDDRLISDFRSFCRENIDILKSDERKFMMMLSARFFLKNLPSRIKHNNTGRVCFENLNLEQLEERIDKLLIDANEFRNRSEDVKKLIDDKGFGTHKVKDAREKGSTLYTWHNTYKGDLKSMLHSYFRVKFNPDLKFNGKLLDQLGFRPCRSCMP